MLISQGIYDAIDAMKRLCHMQTSQSELRPGSDHHPGFGIEILR